MAFKYGCLPGYIPNGLHDLTFYVAGSLPAAPSSVAVPVPPANADGTAWGMDGNDTYGDCGVAGCNHGEMCTDLDTGTPLLGLTDQQIVNYYLTYTGGQDNGVVLADFLSYVQSNGWFGRSLAAYAPVSITDMATLEFAINAYGYAYTGITVTSAMEGAFEARKPWTPSACSGEPVGGHCIPLVGYDENYLYAVTWGAVQPIAFSAWHLIASEAWACIWGEIPSGGLDGHGVNLAALNADLGALGW